MRLRWLCCLIMGLALACALPACRRQPTPPTTTSATSSADRPEVESATSSPASSDALNGITRVKTPDGGLLVTAPSVPKTLRYPQQFPDFADGDWYVDNLGAEPSIITPFLDKDAYGNTVQTPVIEFLLTRDPQTFEWQPWLAESYEQKGDGLTVIYKIRKEARFSDGTPVTADDVVFSYQTMMDPKIDDDRYKAGGERIESCTKIDDRTVAFKFKEPFFQQLEVSGFIGIIPKHIYAYTNPDEYNKRADLLVGSGPYIFKKDQWQRGQRIVLTRNPNYWAPRPAFDRLVYLFIANPQAAFQDFRGGDLDSFGPDPEQFHRFANDPEFRTRYTIYKFNRPNSGYGFIGWNEKHPMFADARTRTALTMLVDRNTMIQTLLYGLAHSITGPFSFMTPQNDPSIKPISFDPRAARALLAEAGWKLNDHNVLVRDGEEFRFELMIPAQVQLYQRVCEVIKRQFAKAGIIVNIAPYEFSVMVDRLDERKFDAAMLGWTGGVEEDPYQIWHSDSIKDKGSNFISWSNPEADKLIEAGRRELDEAKRMKIWHQLHQVIAREQPYTFLWIATARIFIQPRIRNTEPYKLGLNTFDWYVPKALQKYK